jgi:hypothetical protein
MNTTTRFAKSLVAGLFLLGVAACTAETTTSDESSTESESAALINNGGLGLDGDACSITGGPNKGKTGTRSGNYCCTEANGGGHCQDCTTPSDWCSSTVKIRKVLFTAPVGAFQLAR